jgi:hypothetical protein
MKPFSKKRTVQNWRFGGTILGMVLTISTISQAANWMWVSGPNTINQPGVYGSIGVGDANNIPGARTESISWIDSSGNFWLFGGDGCDSSGSLGFLNDLWKYEPANGLWTWVSGSNARNHTGIYGTQKIGDVNNIPGARDGSISWVDSSGDFWLFGGYGYDVTGTAGYLNDLWKYEPTSGLWTWMSGSSTANQNGIYGNKGVPDANNVPGARYDSVSWIDSNDNLWLFGGDGWAVTYYAGYLNDLWKYVPSSSLWTWVSGTNAVGNTGFYGTKGIGDANNVPEARGGAISWKDSKGDVWLFGGISDNALAWWPRFQNDLWKYEPNSSCGSWTWVSGQPTGFYTYGSFGVYGTKGAADANNTPGARMWSTSWIDSNDNLWLFGGSGLDSSEHGALSDLWKFEPNIPSEPNGFLNGLWTWVGGPNIVNQPGIYGTRGVGDSNNIPGARSGSVSWSDGDSNFWLFGGSSNDGEGNGGYFSDLWKLEYKCPVGDLNGDCMVNFIDYAILSSHWLQQGQIEGNLNNDGEVNKLDLNVLKIHWLEKGLAE